MTPDEQSTSPHLTRRHALTGAATIGVGIPLLAACGSGGSEAVDPSPTSASSAQPSASGPGAADAVTTTSAIPVGSGAIFADAGVVVTQPTAGDFKGFSSTCTHAGCTVGSVSDGLIICPCHGSRYSITDGSVQGGPAPSPLPTVALTVKGGEISLA